MFLSNGKEVPLTWTLYPKANPVVAEEGCALDKGVKIYPPYIESVKEGYLIPLKGLDAGFFSASYTDVVLSALIQIEERYTYYCGDMSQLTNHYSSVFKEENVFEEFSRQLGNWVLGYRSNLDARKGRIDPDTYASEMLRAERCKLNFPEIARTLHFLAKQMNSSINNNSPRRENPMFLMFISNLGGNSHWVIEQFIPYLSILKSFPIVIAASVIDDALFEEQSLDHLLKYFILSKCFETKYCQLTMSKRREEK